MRRQAQSVQRAASLKSKTGYLPTLDGWRAIAILGVVFYHDRIDSVGPLSTKWLFENGYAGVDLFFAISGILICWRLLEEEKIFGRISLRNFYIRRGFRILPPALVFLGVVGILAAAGVFHIGLREFVGSAFFFRNYSSLLGHLGLDSGFTDHFWSLAVEEHFYLILPTVLVLTKKRWRLLVLIGLTLAVEAHRMHVLQTRNWVHVLFHTDIRLDDLLIPAIFAVIVQSEKVRDWLKKWLRIWPLILIVAMILVTFWRGVFWQTVLVAVLMPTIILGSVLNPNSYLAIALEMGPLRYLGRISYSLYLWQQIFFIGHFYDQGYPLGILQSTPLRFAGALACSIASYHLLERPMVKLGHRLAPPATPGRDDLSEEAGAEVPGDLRAECADPKS